MDLRKRVETALVDTMAESFQLPPRFGRFQVLRPERKRTALARPGRVDRAALVPENAVAVRLHVEDGVALFIFGDVCRFERADVHFEKAGDTLDLAGAHVDVARLRPAAAAVTLVALEREPVRVPRRLFLGWQDATLYRAPA